MNAIAPIMKLEKFAVTTDIELFGRSDVGALYIDEYSGFKEIPQESLDLLVTVNKETLFKYVDRTMMEFQPDEIFIEKPFGSLVQAKEFVMEVFEQFKIIDWSYCLNIISRLEFFASTLPSEKLNCRFEIISGNSCKKFHYDSVYSRLICTYAGPGTQVKSPDRETVLELRAGSAILAKGKMFPDFKPVTLHRSPPIADQDIKRFLFIVDHSN